MTNVFDWGPVQNDLTQCVNGSEASKRSVSSKDVGTAVPACPSNLSKEHVPG